MQIKSGDSLSLVACFANLYANEFLTQRRKNPQRSLRFLLCGPLQRARVVREVNSLQGLRAEDSTHEPGTPAPLSSAGGSFGPT